MWDELDAFKEQLRRSEGKPEYIFFDGPPFATGLPHYGHILAGTLKVGLLCCNGGGGVDSRGGERGVREQSHVCVQGGRGGGGGGEKKKKTKMLKITLFQLKGRD